MSVNSVCKPHERLLRGSCSRTPPEIRTNKRWSTGGSFRPTLLLWLRTAVLAIAVLIALCFKSEAQQSLSATDIENRIVGHNFKAKKGIVSVSLHYARDGTVTMRSPLGTGTGRWSLTGDELCVKMETGPKMANECLAFSHQSDGTYRASNGLRLTPAE